MQIYLDVLTGLKKGFAVISLLGLTDLANKNEEWPVKLEFLVNSD